MIAYSEGLSCNMLLCCQVFIILRAEKLLFAEAILTIKLAKFFNSECIVRNMSLLQLF